mmetsp:Transcript_113472/g.315627  ORF Transcript_113472/g.315627 Transcript_113472/m.315627 type:complete len:365 (+) Transcript_113472:76-1170(+)
MQPAPHVREGEPAARRRLHVVGLALAALAEVALEALALAVAVVADATAGAVAALGAAVERERVGARGALHQRAVRAAVAAVAQAAHVRVGVPRLRVGGASVRGEAAQVLADAVAVAVTRARRARAGLARVADEAVALAGLAVAQAAAGALLVLVGSVVVAGHVVHALVVHGRDGVQVVGGHAGGGQSGELGVVRARGAGVEEHAHASVVAQLIGRVVVHGASHLQRVVVLVAVLPAELGRRGGGGSGGDLDQEDAVLRLVEGLVLVGDQLVSARGGHLGQHREEAVLLGRDLVPRDGRGAGAHGAVGAGEAVARAPVGAGLLVARADVVGAAAPVAAALVRAAGADDRQAGQQDNNGKLVHSSE